MSKLWRVIGDGETEQVLLETSAENVTVTDTGEKLEATTVEGALSELADGVNEARRANIVDVGQGTPTTENGNTITPVNFIFSNGTSKTVNIYAQQGEKGDTGATGAKIVSTDLIGHTDGGDNIYQQTFDNGSKAKFIAPKGDSGVDDYEELKNQPIIYAILNSISNPVENTYYKHIGETTEKFTNGYIYLYTGGQYKAIDGSGSGGGSANYTKIESTIPTTAWVSSAPSWIGQNALTWSKTGDIYYTQVDTEELGLSSSGTYSAVLTIDGTDYVDEHSEAGVIDGMSVYIAYFNNYSVTLQIADHCSGFDEQGDWVPGNGYNVSVVVTGDTAPSSVIIKSFSGAGGISAIISNSAIKVNSAVTMYIDYNGKIKAVGKADGSLTVSVIEAPTIDIPYAIEIVDTDVEGLFEVINNNFPLIPTIPASLPQTTSNFIEHSISPSAWTKGTNVDGSDYYYSDFNVENMFNNTDALFRVNYAGYIEIYEKSSNGGSSVMRVIVKKLPTEALYIVYRLGQISGSSNLGNNITVVNEFSGYITDKPDHLYLTDTATGTLYEVTIANGTISLVAQSST